MNNDFRSQTTTLQTTFPFKGKGLVNDRLRLDVSGLAANTEYLLSYDTTTGTFAWSTPDDVTGIDTLYNADVTITGNRIVTFADLENGLQFLWDSSGTPETYISASEFYAQVQTVDFYREGIHNTTTLSIANGLFLDMIPTGQVEVDPEDPTSYYKISKQSSFSIEEDSDNGIRYEVYEQGSVNSEIVSLSAGLDCNIEQISMQRTLLVNSENSENTLMNFQLGDTDEGFGFLVNLQNSGTTWAATEANGYDGYVVVALNQTAISHNTYSPTDPAEINLTATSLGDEIEVNFNLITDFSNNLLSRVDTGALTTTHQIAWSSDNFSTTVQAIASDAIPYQEWYASNSGSISSYFYFQQQDADELGDPSRFVVALNNGSNTVQGLFNMEPDVISFEVSGTPTTPAMFQLNSTTQGFLPPRMTTAERDLIDSPVAGLMIYNTTTNKLNVYTTAWEAVTSV